MPPVQGRADWRHKTHPAAFRQAPCAAAGYCRTPDSVNPVLCRAHRLVSGARQGSCRLSHAPIGCLSKPFECPLMALRTASRSGLSVTAPMGVQLRGVPDQRRLGATAMRVLSVSRGSRANVDSAGQVHAFVGQHGHDARRHRAYRLRPAITMHQTSTDLLRILK